MIETSVEHRCWNIFRRSRKYWWNWRNWPTKNWSRHYSIKNIFEIKEERFLICKDNWKLFMVSLEKNVKQKFFCWQLLKEQHILTNHFSQKYQMFRAVADKLRRLKINGTFPASYEWRTDITVVVTTIKLERKETETGIEYVSMKKMLCKKKNVKSKRYWNMVS